MSGALPNAALDVRNVMWLLAAMAFVVAYVHGQRSGRGRTTSGRARSAEIRYREEHEVHEERRDS